MMLLAIRHVHPYAVAAAAVTAACFCVWLTRRLSAAAEEEGFTGSEDTTVTSAVACPKDWKLFADDAGALRCCKGSVNYFSNTCGGGDSCRLATASGEEGRCP